jgi:hypothetical protein
LIYEKKETYVSKYTDRIWLTKPTSDQLFSDFSSFIRSKGVSVNSYDPEHGLAAFIRKDPHTFIQMIKDYFINE